MIRSCFCGRFKVDDEVYPKNSTHGLTDCLDCHSGPHSRPADATALRFGDGWAVFTKNKTTIHYPRRRPCTPKWDLEKLEATDGALPTEEYLKWPPAKDIARDLERLEPVYRHLGRSSTPEIRPHLYYPANLTLSPQMRRITQELQAVRTLILDTRLYRPARSKFHGPRRRIARLLRSIAHLLHIRA